MQDFFLSCKTGLGILNKRCPAPIVILALAKEQNQTFFKDSSLYFTLGSKKE